MKQDRFLTYILIGIAALILLALGLFYTRGDSAMTYGADDSPAGVVHNYVVAVFQKDYARAYSYLADKPNKPTLEQFRQSFLQNYIGSSNIGVDIGETAFNGSDHAVVTLNIQYGNGSDPFSSGYRNQEQASLVQQNGAWRIEQMPYNFWSYDWYPSYPPTPYKP